ncbi:MAG: sterol carrier protein [Deltaproteobacteria bacterium]|nr:MAG: sterol carrier protein [Deltaproteobacteria bacterium]
MSDVQASFERLEQSINDNTEKATSANAIFTFELTGDDGGVYTVDLRNGASAPFVSVGPDDNANVTITMTASDWTGILGGSVNPMQAFMMGKIKVKGDMGLAMKLQNILALAK